MPIFVGGRKISGNLSSDPSSGLTEGDQYYKTDTDQMRFYNGTSWGDMVAARGSESNPAFTAQELYSAGNTTSGYYYIRLGDMIKPVRVWCDMTSGDSNTGGAGGWMRFWWHGTFEQTGSDPTSFPNGDCFGNKLEDLTHSATTGFGKIPEGFTPKFLMVKTNNAQVSKNGSLLRYACWSFDNTGTSNSVLASMQSGTTRSSSSSGQNNWQPVLNASNNSSGWPGNVGAIDFWWYSDDNQSGRGKGFNLDDDGAYGNTSFAGGRDNGGNLGVDGLTYGSPVNIATNNLSFFFK